MTDRFDLLARITRAIENPSALSDADKQGLLSEFQSALNVKRWDRQPPASLIQEDRLQRILALMDRGAGLNQLSAMLGISTPVIYSTLAKANLDYKTLKETKKLQRLVARGLPDSFFPPGQPVTLEPLPKLVCPNCGYDDVPPKELTSCPGCDVPFTVSVRGQNGHRTLVLNDVRKHLPI